MDVTLRAHLRNVGIQVDARPDGRDLRTRRANRAPIEQDTRRITMSWDVEPMGAVGFAGSRNLRESVETEASRAFRAKFGDWND